MSEATIPPIDDKSSGPLAPYEPSYERRDQDWPTEFRLALTDDGLVLQGKFIWRMREKRYGYLGEQGHEWRTLPTVDLRSPRKTLRERIEEASSQSLRLVP